MPETPPLTPDRLAHFRRLLAALGPIPADVQETADAMDERYAKTQEELRHGQPATQDHRYSTDGGNLIDARPEGSVDEPV